MTWTADHIAYLQANLHRPDEYIAAVLNRSVESVAKYRTRKLRALKPRYGHYKKAA